MSSESDPSVKRVTIEELQRADGKGGRPAWVCHGGKVYDVSASKLWAGGQHMNSHQAGRELTRFVESAPHDTEVFQRVVLVGELVPAEKDAVPLETESRIVKPPALLKKILGLHPHPVTVHFPIALSITAALFTLLGLIISSELLQLASLCNLCVAALAVPAVMVTGFLSWRFNYQGRRSGLFSGKVGLSIIFAALLFTALIIRLLVVDLYEPAGFWYWIHNLIVLALASNVMVLGYLGGRITFPR